MPEISSPNPIEKSCTFKSIETGSTSANTYVRRKLSSPYFQTSQPSGAIFSLDDANDQIEILEAGLYYVDIATVAFSCGRFISVLRAGNNVVRILGTSNSGITTGNVNSDIKGYLTVTPNALGTSGAKFSVETMSVNTKATDGLGAPANMDSQANVYVSGIIRKVRDLIPSEE